LGGRRANYQDRGGKGILQSPGIFDQGHRSIKTFLKEKSMEKHGLKIKCRDCGITIQADWGHAKVRITGALEMECPACKKVSIYIGRFGQEIELERAVEDVQKAIEDQQKQEEKNGFET
jgi:ribosomal protein S27E